MTPEIPDALRENKLLIAVAVGLAVVLLLAAVQPFQSGSPDTQPDTPTTTTPDTGGVSETTTPGNTSETPLPPGPVGENTTVSERNSTSGSPGC